jgi:hypothetical protein
VARWHLQGCSLRLYRLRTDGLAPTRKYWACRSHTGVMDPVNRCSLLSTDTWLSLLLQWLFLRGKLGRAPMNHSAELGVVSGAIFLESSRVHPMLWMTCERLSCTWIARKKCTRGVRELSWEAYVSCVSGFSLQGIHRFESPWLSDKSNRLSHDSLHVAK